jgi:hypothetical protein
MTGNTMDAECTSSMAEQHDAEGVKENNKAKQFSKTANGVLEWESNSAHESVGASMTEDVLPVPPDGGPLPSGR